VAHSPSLAGGHERQLVGGQRPHCAGRHDDRQPLGVPPVDVAQQPAVVLRVTAGPPRRGALQARGCAATGSEQERLEAKHTAVVQSDLPAPVADLDDGVDDQLCAGLLGEP
jgi:hypothetical protein